MLSFKFVTVYSLKAPPASVKSQTKTTFENGVSEQINTKVVLSVLGLKGVCYKGNVFFNLNITIQHVIAPYLLIISDIQYN